MSFEVQTKAKKAVQSYNLTERQIVLVQEAAELYDTNASNIVRSMIDQYVPPIIELKKAEHRKAATEEQA